jgi:hypothetical protein
LPAPSPWRQRIALGFVAARLGIAVALLPFAIDWRSPLLAGLRPVALAALIAGSLLLIAIDAWMISATPQTPIRRALSVAVILAAGAALTATVALEARFQWVRAFRRRLPRYGRARAVDRAARHRRRVHGRPQCRRAFGRRRP